MIGQRKQEKLAVAGFLTITTKDRATGEVTQYMSDKNVVTDNGISKLVDNLTSTTSVLLDNFAFGDDVGTGNEFAPEPAKTGYNSAMQNVLFRAPSTDITINVVGGNKLVAETTISGNQLITNYFASELSINITSATFRFNDDTTLSYKRFPAKVISKMTDIIVQWEIEFTNDCN